MNGPVCGVGDYKAFALNEADVEALMPLVMQSFESAKT